MKVAIPTWEGKISPVFDVARYLLVVNIKEGAEISRHKEALPEMEVTRRAKHITGLGVDSLICGAISRPLEMLLLSSGVKVISQICGPVEEVLKEFLSGQMTFKAFQMPGCCGQGRRFRGRRQPGRPEFKR